MTRLTILRAQAAYYVVTGVSPLLSRRAFEAITGPKFDWWLVQMVGLLAATIGAALAVGAQERPVATSTRMLSLLAAVSFAAIDTAYALRGRIRPVYLLDAAVEALFVLGVETCGDHEDGYRPAQPDERARLL